MRDYWERLRQSLLGFWKPGDVLTLIDIVLKKGEICGLCGKVPISNCYVLKNRRTSKKIVIGSDCYRNFWNKAYKLGDKPVIKCSRKLSAKGLKILNNGKILTVETI
jgi:hypothetical protein